MQIVVANSKGGCGKSTLVMALADVLDAQIVDHDLQGTIRKTAHYSGRHRPIGAQDFSKKFLLHDTPPYNSGTYKSLLDIADLVLIPVKLAHADLLAVQGIVDQLRDLNQTHKGRIIFNEVRKPDTRVQRKLRAYFSQNYMDITKVNTELSFLSGFRDIMETPVYGAARKEIAALLQELGILYT